MSRYLDPKTVVVGLIEESAYKPGELEAYETYWNAVSTEKTLLTGRYQEGLAAGEKKGLEKGLKKGLQKGLIEGERKNSEMIARDMMREGFDLETIAKLTKLPLDIISRLKL